MEGYQFRGGGGVRTHSVKRESCPWGGRRLETRRMFEKNMPMVGGRLVTINKKSALSYKYIVNAYGGYEACYSAIRKVG